MNTPVNPFNLPNPAPGVVAAVSMESFDRMSEWEECEDPQAGMPEDDAVEASENNFNFNLDA